MEPAPGKLLAGRYRLEQQLAEGGMGTVWVARHVDLDVDVAVKFMSDDLAGDTVGRNRFKREARAAAMLKSPHVTHIHDYGVDDGTPYIAMELLEGQALDERLDEMGRLTPEEAEPIVRQLASGLTAAHEAGIVHRDLKPSNIFLARTGDAPIVKILDFGIAKETNPQLVVGDRTKSGTLIGSPRYMSPEQALGEPLDQRSDLWSFGVVIFEMLTGHCPFDDEHLGQLIRAITTASPPSVRDHVPSLPESVDAFFERALAKLADDRFETARDVADACIAALGGKPPSAEVVVGSSARVDGHDETVEQSAGRPQREDTMEAATLGDATREPSSPRRARPFIALGVLALVAGGLWVGLSGQPRSVSMDPTPIETPPKTPANLAGAEEDGAPGPATAAPSAMLSAVPSATAFAVPSGVAEPAPSATSNAASVGRPPVSPRPLPKTQPKTPTPAPKRDDLFGLPQ